MVRGEGALDAALLVGLLCGLWEVERGRVIVLLDLRERVRRHCCRDRCERC